MGQTESKVVEWKAKTKPCPEHPNVKTPAGNVVDDMDLLRRFLFLHNTLHVNPKQEYADLINRLIKEERGTEVVQLIAEISHTGLAPRQNNIIFALAVCTRSNNDETKKLAYDILCQICRIPTHFFMFVNYYNLQIGQSKGWGRAHRRAVLNWYEEKCNNPEGIARTLTKYKSRKMVAKEGKSNRWSHKDIFRLCHPSSADILMKVVSKFVLYGFKEAQSLASLETTNDERVTKFMTYIEGTINAKKCTDEDELIELIRRHSLEKEHVPDRFLNSDKVWEAIIKNMQPEAMIRSICMLSAKGFCDEDSKIEEEIIEKLSKAKYLHAARLHPIRVLSALLTYEKGEKTTAGGTKKNLTVNKNIVKALNKAFELSLPLIYPTRKRILLAINVSDKMKSPCGGFSTIMCTQAAAAMVMNIARIEPYCKIVGFSESLTQIHFDENVSLSQMLQRVDSLPSGKAMNALPILWAKENKKKIDVFIVYTDNIPDEEIHPSVVLEEYRATMIPEAKLIVAAMVCNPYTIGDSTERFVTGIGKDMERDLKAINIIGIDSRAAVMISKFIRDEI